MKRFAFVALLLLAGVALAHDLITAESAEKWLEDAARLQQQTANAAPAAQRAHAHLRIGAMLDEIRDLLNRDLAAHGEVRGLASNFLVSELARIGTPLAYSDERRFFVTNADHYRAALKVGLTGTEADEARLRLLRGAFYDSFEADLLQTTDTEQQVMEQLALAEQVVAMTPREPDREEVRFIAAVVCTRAAKLAAGKPSATMLRDKAHGYMDAFLADYPGSLRSAAMPVLRQALDARR